MRRLYPLLYKDGVVIFEEDSTDKEIYMIESGKVEISYRAEGEKKRIVLLEKGDFFGEMAPITGTVRSATATAVEDTYLVSFTMEEMFDRMEGDREFMFTVLWTLISRLRETTSALRSLPFRTHYPERTSAESSTPEERHLADIGEEEGIPKESYQRLQKTVIYLEEQIQEKDKEIQEKDKEIESLRSQLEKRRWFKRKSAG